jgi:hypothetical protein
LGEHTGEILREVLGYSEADVRRIEGSGAVGEPTSHVAAQ